MFRGDDTGGGTQRNMGIDHDAGLFLDVPRTVIASVSPSNILACLYRIGFLDGADDLFWCELRAGWYAQLCLTKATNRSYIALCMAKHEVSPDSVDFHFVVQHFHLSGILYNATHQQYCVCNINGTLQVRLINAELSLQNTSHNSRENNQRLSWLQIREL